MIRTLVALLLMGIGAAEAHEHWINRGGFKNSAGEWCCGEGDCHKVLVIELGGYWVVVDGGKVIRKGTELPSLDGEFWLCLKPDGTPRCFFAPPPPS